MSPPAARWALKIDDHDRQRDVLHRTRVDSARADA
jgi:hypothetical protein